MLLFDDTLSRNRHIYTAILTQINKLRIWASEANTMRTINCRWNMALCNLMCFICRGITATARLARTGCGKGAYRKTIKSDKVEGGVYFAKAHNKITTNYLFCHTPQHRVSLWDTLSTDFSKPLCSTTLLMFTKSVTALSIAIITLQTLLIHHQ